MTRQYLTGELSVRLERLQATASTAQAVQVTELRYRVESCPASRLAEEVSLALALAEKLCWDSLSQGDAISFASQASVSADLRQFGICSGLLAEDDLPSGTSRSAD